MPSNPDTWLVTAGKPLEIREACSPQPADNEIVVESHSFAISPCDLAVEMYGPALFPWIALPSVVGEDVAGNVVSVGRRVTKFKIGDRVIGYSSAAFQKYLTIREHIAYIIPSSIAYEQVAVFPLAFTTASISLFRKDYLALILPCPKEKAEPTGEVPFITGDPTSVGSNAIVAHT